MSTAPSSDVHEQFNLSGRVALITSGSGYLGGPLAEALAEAGAAVVVASRDLARAEAVAAKLPGAAQHHAVAIDQLDAASIEQGFADAVGRAGKVDILVNNGHAHAQGDLTNVSASEFDKQLGNATGYFLLARAVRDHAVAREAPAAVVMLGSMYGMVGSYPDAYDGVCPASPVAYHALKGGILQMTRHLAVYWAGDRVRVNALSPGPFPAPTAPPEMVARLRTRSPLGRMGEPHELKGPLLLLVSDAGQYITGQNLVVDGGWTAW